MNSLEEIINQIHQSKESRPELAELNSESRVSVWRNFIYIIAFAIDLLRQMFETHKTELNELIATKKIHSGIWIREQLLGFQLGFTLVPGTDRWYNTGKTEAEIEASKIIKYAAVTESVDEKRVICKIAGETDGELAPLGESEIEAVGNWLMKIKAAGVPYTVINYLPDLLQLNITIYRDPLVLTQSGTHRISGKEVVKDALKEFMKELPFNGELRIQELSNKLEQTEGVNLVSVGSVLSSWINPETGNYGDWEAVQVRKIAESGYFKIQDFNGIIYAV